MPGDPLILLKDSSTFHQIDHTITFRNPTMCRKIGCTASYGVHKLWVFSTDKPHTLTSQTKPRTEIAILVSYAKLHNLPPHSSSFVQLIHKLKVAILLLVSTHACILLILLSRIQLFFGCLAIWRICVRAIRHNRGMHHAGFRAKYSSCHNTNA